VSELTWQWPVTGSDIVVKERIEKTIAKNARGLRRDKAPPLPLPRSCASYFCVPFSIFAPSLLSESLERANMMTACTKRIEIELVKYSTDFFKVAVDFFNQNVHIF